MKTYKSNLLLFLKSQHSFYLEYGLFLFQQPAKDLFLFLQENYGSKWWKRASKFPNISNSQFTLLGIEAMVTILQWQQEN